MPIYVYVCARKHRTEVIVPITEFKEEIVCNKCAKKDEPRMAQIEVSQTAKPRFVAGVGGFYKPNA